MDDRRPADVEKQRGDIDVDADHREPWVEERVEKRLDRRAADMPALADDGHEAKQQRRNVFGAQKQRDVPEHMRIVVGAGVEKAVDKADGRIDDADDPCEQPVGKIVEKQVVAGQAPVAEDPRADAEAVFEKVDDAPARPARPLPQRRFEIDGLLVIKLGGLAVGDEYALSRQRGAELVVLGEVGIVPAAVGDEARVDHVARAGQMGAEAEHGARAVVGHGV